MAKIVAPERKKGRRSARFVPMSALMRIVISGALGTAGAALIGIYLSWGYAPLVFWDVTALGSAALLWIALGGMNAKETEQHATQEDPGRVGIGVIMLCASVASLAAVVVLVIQAAGASGMERILDVCLGIVSIVISWIIVHLVYMLRYADVYFKDKKGIDFNTDEAATYQDFAYVAFTVGMTYQVSDTSLKTTGLRRLARQHAIISYIFGTAIIATTINAIAGLGK